MEQPISRRNPVRNRNKTLSVTKKSAQYAVAKAVKQDLTPLQRLQKFKKLQERQAKVRKSDYKKSGVKRVTFADEMTSEAIALNGSHEPETDNDEKILKPRKSILSNDQDNSALQNGSNENGSVSENGDNDNIENGHDSEYVNGEVSKANKKSQRQKNMQEKRESTPNRQSLFREAKVVKESTPKPETPSKRELRQSTPRKTTPKRESKPRGTPKVYPSESNEPEIVEEGPQDGDDAGASGEEKSPKTKDHIANEKAIDSQVEESIVVIEEKLMKKNKFNDENIVVNITESEDEVVVKESPISKGFFSAFRSISKRSSLEMKDACEASSSSIICLDSPSLSDEKIVPSKEIKGRKPINSFSRFPGRNVSITSENTSLKRKAEESFEEEDRKRFAGETASGSEKSPGWNFFSPSKMWSPQQMNKTHLPTSTPFHKREEQDSMAVNYDSKTKLDIDESGESDTLSTKQKGNNKWCTVM